MNLSRIITLTIWILLAVGLFNSPIQSGFPGIGDFEIVSTKALEVCDLNGTPIIRMAGINGGVITIGDETDGILIAKSKYTGFSISIIKDGAGKAVLHTNKHGKGELILLNEKGKERKLSWKK